MRDLSILHQRKKKKKEERCWLKNLYLIEVGFTPLFQPTAILKGAKLAYFCYIILNIFIYYYIHFVKFFIEFTYNKRQYSRGIIFCPVITFGGIRGLNPISITSKIHQCWHLLSKYGTFTTAFILMHFSTLYYEIFLHVSYK